MRGLYILLITVGLSFCTHATENIYEAIEDLNVREGAGIDYPVLFVLKKGDKVHLISEKDSWFEIQHSGKRGFAYSKYLKKSISNTDNIQDKNHFISYIFIIILLLVVLRVYLTTNKKNQQKKLLEGVTSKNRGTSSERLLILKLLKNGFRSEDLFHDLYVKKVGGGFSQIDAVLLSNAGIIVFEVKDYKGWIFGSGNQRKWTQVLAYGEQKHKFYNPVYQNNQHIRELKKLLGLNSEIPFFSIIVFFGDCTLKEIDFIPKTIYVSKEKRILEVISTILKENESIKYSNKKEIIDLLKQAVKNGENIDNQLKHVENIKEMLGEKRVYK